MNLFNKKLKGIPSVQIHKENEKYHMIFDIRVKTIKEFMADLGPSNKVFEFCKLTQLFDNLVNTLAFLQTLKICPQNLNDDNLYIDPDTNQIYMIDLVMSSFDKIIEDGNGILIIYCIS